MKLDIRTSNLKPRRQTYAHIARRFGEDRPATRYEEAVLDLQATNNFHYRPTWDPEHELYDKARTAIAMEDWYALTDPRQYYYGTYNISRSKMRQVTESNFDLVEKRDLLGTVDAGWKKTIEETLIPMRHYEWGANMNNFYVADFGYGTAITSAAAFQAADRLGMAQLISNIGLALDDSTGKSLDAAKTLWLEADFWQPARRAVEDSFVVKDWFETFVAQNLVLDGVFHPLVFSAIDRAGLDKGGMALSMLTEFAIDWFADSSRWVDAVTKRAAAESGENKALLSKWAAEWKGRAVEAAHPVAVNALGEGASTAVKEIVDALEARFAKLGLEVL